MDDRRQAGISSRYVTIKVGLLSLPICPCVSAVSTGESWDAANRHTARCTSPVSVVRQCKL